MSNTITALEIDVPKLHVRLSRSCGKSVAFETPHDDVHLVIETQNEFDNNIFTSYITLPFEDFKDFVTGLQRMVD